MTYRKSDQQVRAATAVDRGACWSLMASGLLIALLSGCAGDTANLPNPREPFAIRDVVSLSKSGTPSEQVERRVQSSRTTYALRGSDFGKLKNLGVPDAVLDYLQQSFIDDLDLLTRLWVLGQSLGGCGFCYPQPLDVNTMQSGYANLGLEPPTHFVVSKPPGTPEWVVYPLSSFTAEPLSVNQVVEMAKGGIPPAALVQRIHRARLTNLTSVSSTIRGHPHAGLGGATLAALGEQGVPEDVLDALQAQFLAQFIEAQRLRYQNFQY
jgi:hypothetical protein